MDEFKSLIENYDVNLQNSSQVIEYINKFSAMLSNQELLQIDNISLLIEKFYETFTRILPLTESQNKNIMKSANFFINHWGNLFSSVNPNFFLQFCHKLFQNENLAQYSYQLIIPIASAFLYMKNDDDFISMMSDNADIYVKVMILIVKESNPSKISKIPMKAWSILKSLLNEDQVEDLVIHLSKVNASPMGASILCKKNYERLLDPVFNLAKIDFLLLFLKNLPRDLKFDVLLISSRISEALVEDGQDPEIAFQMIPYVVKEELGELNEIMISAFHPFWKVGIKYLKDNHSFHALLAMYSGYKVGLVTKETVLSLLNFENSQNSNYLISSFQIALHMFECVEIQEKVVNIINEVSMTRGNAMFCCLVDNMKIAYPKLLQYNEQFAYDTINTIMNPIPFDKYLPPFVVKMLLSIPNIDENPNFLFNIEDVVYKYMTLSSEQITKDLKQLVKKYKIKINMLNVDWFGSSLSTSISLVSNVEPNIIKELLDFEIFHISLIPQIINKLRKTGFTGFLNNGMATFAKILQVLGLDIKADSLPFPLEDSWLSDGYINGCVQFLEIPIGPSYLGSILKSLIKYFCMVVDQTHQDNGILDILFNFAVHISQIIPDYSLLLLAHIKVNFEDKDKIEQMEKKLSKYIDLGDPLIISQYLLFVNGPEKALELSEKKVKKAISVKYSLAEAFAPYIKQPLDKMTTFLAFQGIEEHKEWVEQCKLTIKEDQWVHPKDHNDTIEEKKFAFQPIDSSNLKDGILGFLDGTKYSLIRFLYFSTEDINTYSQKQSQNNIQINEIEEYVINHSEDIRLVIGFFYYAKNNQFHTERAEEWVKLIKFDYRSENKDDNNLNNLGIYAASLFLSTLTGYKFNSFPNFLSQFILSGLKSLGYYALSKDLLIYAFKKESFFRWYYIRSIISLDTEYFSDNAIITVEFAEDEKIFTIYNSFFENMKTEDNINSLMNIFVSLTRTLFRPPDEYLIQNKYYPLAHNCLYSLKNISTLPPPKHLEQDFINAFLNALKQQKFFPVLFFVFFAHVKLTNEQFQFVHELIEPRNSAANSFYMHLLPSVYFEENEIKASLDSKAAIHFSNKPPSFSRAFYRSCLIPFTPILPQKLINEIKDLICDVFPPFSYNALNVWPNINNYDKIMRKDYPENIIDQFKVVSHETIDILTCVLSDSNFPNQSEIIEESIKTFLSDGSNVSYIINIWKALIKFGISKMQVEKIIYDEKIVNSFNFLHFCVLFSLVKKYLNKENLKEEIKSIISEEGKKTLFDELPSSKEKIIYNL